MSRKDENMISIYERKILRSIFGGIQENGTWRRRLNSELYRSYEESDIVNFVKIQRIKCAARATIDLLKDTFGDRLISRFGPVNRPPRSCDLTPLDYFLWGYVKSLVYADKPQTLDHLEDNILRVIADIRPQMLEKVIENWTSRSDYIRASRGSPMPEIIFKIIPLRNEWSAKVVPFSYGNIFVWSLQGFDEVVSVDPKLVKHLINPGINELKLTVWNSFGHLNASMLVQAAFTLIALNYSFSDFFIGRNGSLSVTVNQLELPDAIFVDFGDGNSYDSTINHSSLLYERHENNSSTFTIMHTYQIAGLHAVYFNASNSISHFEHWTMVNVAVPISGVRLELLSPSTVALFEEVIVQCTVEKGSDIDFDWDFGDGTDGQYTMVNRYIINVTAQNHISSISSPHLVLHLIQKIANLTSIYCQGPNLVNHVITFRALYWFGTNLTFQWDFGDGSPVKTTHSSFIEHIYKEYASHYLVEMSGFIVYAESSVNIEIVHPNPVAYIKGGYLRWIGDSDTVKMEAHVLNLENNNHSTSTLIESDIGHHRQINQDAKIYLKATCENCSNHVQYEWKVWRIEGGQHKMHYNLSYPDFLPISPHGHVLGSPDYPIPEEGSPGESGSAIARDQIYINVIIRNNLGASTKVCSLVREVKPLQLNVTLIQYMHENWPTPRKYSWKKSFSVSAKEHSFFISHDHVKGISYYFDCSKWLSAEKGDGQIERELTISDTVPSFSSLTNDYALLHISESTFPICLLVSAVVSVPHVILTILFRYAKTPSINLDPKFSQIFCFLSLEHLYCWLQHKNSNSSRSSGRSSSSVGESDSFYSSFEESSVMSIPELMEESFSNEEKDEFPTSVSSVSINFSFTECTFWVKHTFLSLLCSFLIFIPCFVLLLTIVSSLKRYAFKDVPKLPNSNDQAFQEKDANEISIKDPSYKRIQYFKKYLRPPREQILEQFRQTAIKEKIIFTLQRSFIGVTDKLSHPLVSCIKGMSSIFRAYRKPEINRSDHGANMFFSNVILLAIIAIHVVLFAFLRSVLIKNIPRGQRAKGIKITVKETKKVLKRKLTECFKSVPPQLVAKDDYVLPVDFLLIELEQLAETLVTKANNLFIENEIQEGKKLEDAISSSVIEGYLNSQCQLFEKEMTFDFPISEEIKLNKTLQQYSPASNTESQLKLQDFVTERLNATMPRLSKSTGKNLLPSSLNASIASQRKFKHFPTKNLNFSSSLPHKIRKTYPLYHMDSDSSLSSSDSAVNRNVVNGVTLRKTKSRGKGKNNELDVNILDDSVL
ncbi:hypothetical protein TNCV_2615871 [Trichonephila clavipes]|nr:hypothetical protein TNCV_2615871 [Trichonephila clavipes]